MRDSGSNERFESVGADRFMTVMVLGRIIRASRLWRTVLFAGAHGARAVSAHSVTPLSR